MSAAPSERSIALGSTSASAPDETIEQSARGSKGTAKPDVTVAPGGDVEADTFELSSDVWLGRLNDYDLLGEIDRGGMGVVYRARDRKLNRIVALKVTRSDLLISEHESQRLRVEAEAAAKLDHPQIVPIYEVGQSDGRHFFSMALVDGASLAKRIGDRPLPPRDAAALIAQVSEAVGYAHGRGVVHRDLKPANILVDSHGQPRVTDFGLAKRTDSESGLTQTGQIMGTPSYMSPEQAEGRNDEVGPLADVYSLGATLYCLVTGRPPFQAASSIETLKQVVEREPLAPHFLNPAVDRDLDTICLKCLEKQPQKRYASAIALADDLRRFLERRPIHARPVSRLEKGVRWCRRNPVVAGSLSGVVGIFVAAFVLVTWSYLRAERALEEQATQRRHADLAREDAERKRLAERWERYRSTVAAASAALELQNTGTARSALAAAPSELRDWEWRFLESQLDGARQVWNVPGGEVMQISVDRSGRRIAAACKNDRNVYQYDIGVGRGCPTARDGGSPISALVMSPDGTRIAAGYADGSVGIADAATGQRIGIYRGVTPSLLMLYSPDGTRIATYEGSNTRLLDGSTGAEVAALAGMRDRAGLPVDHKIWQRKRVDGLGEALASTDAIAFSADGKRVAAAAAEYVRVCDAMTGELEWSLGPHDAPVRMVIISRDGRLIAASTYGGSDSIYLWEVSTGRQLAVFRGHKAIVLKMDFSPDGRRLASASNYPDNTARIWDAIGGKSLAVMTGHKNWVVHVAFSPDGKRVLTTSGDQTARIWDGENGTPLSVLSGHTALVANGAFSPDGTRILTASIDGGLRLWDAATAELIAVLRGHVDGIVPELVFAPDGSRLVSGSNDGTVRVWDLKLVERNGILRGHESFVYDVAFSPDGKQIASAAWDGTARLWEATTGRQTGTLKHEKPIVAGVAYSGDGRRLATSERDRGYSIWDVMTGQPVVTLNASAGYFLADTRVALNQHGTRFAAGCAQGPVRIWDLTGKPEAVEFKGHERCSIDVCFHPTRDELASTGEDGTVRIWDISASTCLATLRAHSGSVWRAVYSGDGKLLASGSSDKTVRVWDAQTYKEIRSVSVGSVIYSLAFSPDGRRLAAGCSDNAIRLIDVESGQEVAELRGHSSYVHGVAWSSDGTRIVSASGDFTLRVWDSLSSQDRANMDQ